jgi:glutathione S-transferase
LYKGLQLLEDTMASDYIVGNHVTLADLSTIAIVDSLSTVMEDNLSQYPKVKAWTERMKQLPYYKETNESGLAKLKASIQHLTGKKE